MMIHKVHLPRRTILRGLGASIALPLLDAMVPAATALSRTAAVPVRRLGMFYVPNGMAMGYWAPKTEGTEFEMTPTLQPLASVRDRMLVLSGLEDKNAWAAPGEGAGDHARAAGTYLTGVRIKQTFGADLRAGISVDQVAARHLGTDTQLASLELAVESIELLGSCDASYSCAYANTISWRNESTPLPMENDPRAVFERLFGATDSTDAASRHARVKQDRSILDFVSAKAKRLESSLGTRDRTKLTQYLDAVRDVERRIQKAEEQGDRDLPVLEQPSGIPGDYAQHAQLMLDLLALAYQTDMTRVSSFMLAREVSTRAYPEIGVADSHHPLSHHENEPGKIAKLAKVNEYQMRQFAHFVEQLRKTPDGDGTLLDHSVLVYGTGISDSNTHFHDDLPIVVVGGAAAGIKGGRHVRYPKGTPLANLWVALLEKMGVAPEQLGDSTGALPHLQGV